MPLVDYGSSGSDDDELPPVAAPAVVLAAPVRAPTAHTITPAARRIERPVDLAVLMRLRAKEGGLEAGPKAAQPLPAPKTLSAAVPPAPAPPSTPIVDLAAPVPSSLNAKRSHAPAPASAEAGEAAPKRPRTTFDAGEFYDAALTAPLPPPTTQVCALGAGRHQLKDVIRNAQENEAALTESFKQARAGRQATRKRYGF